MHQFSRIVAQAADKRDHADKLRAKGSNARVSLLAFDAATLDAKRARAAELDKLRPRRA
ncbi:MAG: hypothetical protein RR101_13265 [Burkholderiaceae bacterium]